jgi:glucokinase
MHIGLDLGGTKCLGVALEVGDHRPLEILAEVRLPTPQGSEAILDTMVEVITAVAAEIGDPGEASDQNRISVGVGVPGLITSDGIMRASPNLPGMYEVNIAEQISGRLGSSLGGFSLERVRVDNDANCAALAEWAYGAGRGIEDLVMVTLGTGIGGGLVLGGRPYRGRHGFAGEFGHMVIDPLGHQCPCGQRGCWERYGSGSGLAQLGMDAGMSPGADSEVLRSEDVVAAARAGYPVATGVMKELSRWIALGLVNLANLFDPRMIIVGGGLASEADLYLPEVRRLFTEFLYESSHREHPHIEIAELDHRAGAIGAAVGAAL